MLYHASLYDLVPAEPWLIRFGWMGVDLFFVLSGYLIAGQLLRAIRAGEADYGRFMARRLFRTVPAYLCVVAIYFAIPQVREREQIQPLWQFLTFTQNFGLVLPKAFSHAWSLCVEEHFYLLAPLVLALVARRPRAWSAGWIIVALIAAGMLVRAVLWLALVADTPFDASAEPNGGRYMTWIYYPTWARLDGLLAGVAAAAIQLYRPGVWTRLRERPNLLLAASLVGVWLSAAVFEEQVPDLVGAIAGYPLLAWALALAVIAGTDARCWIARREIPFVGAIAASAYSLYLTHKAVFHAVAAWLPDASATLVVLLATLCAAAAGALLYVVVERPFIRLRARLGPSR